MADASDAIVVPPVAFVPRSATSARLFSQILVIVSEADDACQEYKAFENAGNAPTEARWLVLAVAPGVGENTVDAGSAPAAEVFHYCPGDRESDGGVRVVANAGTVDVTAYTEATHIAGTYQVGFGSSNTIRGAFDVGFCDTSH